MPSGELATVLVRLTADASDFIDGMDQANSELKKFAESAAAIEGAGVFIVGGLVAAAESASKLEAQIFNLNQRTGVATDTLSALSVAALAQGSSLDAVQVAFRKLALEAENAALGNMKAIETFKAIGVSVTDSHGHLKELSDLFPEVDQGLANLSNTTLRAGLSNDLYGRSSLTLLPILGAGTDKLEQFKEMAEQTGVMVSDAEARQGKSFQITQMIVLDSIKNLSEAMGDILMPSFIAAADAIAKHLEQVRLLVIEYPIIVTLIENIGIALIGAGGLMLAIAAVTGGVLLFSTGIGEIAIIATGVVTAIAVVGAAMWTFAGGLAGVSEKFAIWLEQQRIYISVAALMAKVMGQDVLAGGLASLSSAIDSAAIKMAQFSDEQTHGMNASSAYQAQLDKLIDQIKGVGDGHLEAKTKVDQFQVAVDKLVGSVMGTTKADLELVTALSRMTAAGYDENDIIDKLGPKILAYANTLLEAGKPLDAITQYYYDLITAQKYEVEQVNAFENAWQKAQGVIQNNMATMADWQVKSTGAIHMTAEAAKEYVADLTIVIAGENELLKALYKDELTEKIKMTDEALANDQTYARKIRDLTAATAEYKRLTDEAYYKMKLDSAALDLMATQGYSEQEVKDHKDKLDQDIAAWRAYNNEYLKLDKETIATSTRYHEQFFTSQDQAMQTMTINMAKAMGNITSNIASELSKDIVTWSGWAASLKKIATDVAEQMFQAFLNGLLNPLTNALKSVGMLLSSFLSAGIGSIFSGGLSSLFGGGGTMLFGAGYAEGTPYVQNTGLAVVHEGERIITAMDNAALMSGGGMASIPSLNFGTGQSSMQVGSASGGSSSGMNEILVAILTAIRQGQRIVVNAQTLGQVSAAALRNRTLVAASVTQAGR